MVCKIVSLLQSRLVFPLSAACLLYDSLWCLSQTEVTSITVRSNLHTTQACVDRPDYYSKEVSQAPWMNNLVT